MRCMGQGKRRLKGMSMMAAETVIVIQVCCLVGIVSASVELGWILGDDVWKLLKGKRV